MCTMITKSKEEVIETHLYVVKNTNDVISYLYAHKDNVKENDPRQLEKWVLVEHNKAFMTWSKE